MGTTPSIDGCFPPTVEAAARRSWPIASYPIMSTRSSCLPTSSVSATHWRRPIADTRGRSISARSGGDISGRSAFTRSSWTSRISSRSEKVAQLGSRAPVRQSSRLALVERPRPSGRRRRRSCRRGSVARHHPGLGDIPRRARRLRRRGANPRSCQYRPAARTACFRRRPGTTPCPSAPTTRVRAEAEGTRRGHPGPLLLRQGDLGKLSPG